MEKRATDAWQVGYPVGYCDGSLRPAMEGMPMCQRATCRTCGKATYSGCGMHVEQALAGVPASQRCDCETRPERPARGLRSLLRRR